MSLVEKIEIKIDLPGIAYAEIKAKILNELKTDINKGDFQIEFIGASTGSLILYAYTSVEALTTDENLQTELSSFMRRILCQGKFEIPPYQWVDAVIFPVADNKELIFNSAAKKSLSLQFNVPMDVFETDARLESEIGACMQRTIKNLNGQSYTEDVTAIVEYVQSGLDLYFNERHQGCRNQNLIKIFRKIFHRYKCVRKFGCTCRVLIENGYHNQVLRYCCLQSLSI